MRVTWVHPSWRDLVIATLAEDAGLRRRFLAHCGVDGAALALSPERPLLREDADWDALGDGLHHLCPELEEADAVRLLNVLDAAGEDAEVLALDELVLRRLGWGGRVVGVDALCAWAPVAAKLPAAPEPPAVAATWAQLEPCGAPRSPIELERFADWMRLAQMLRRYDPERLQRLGFPHAYEDTLAEFAGDGPVDEPVLERELRLETLDRLMVVDPQLAGRALTAAAELQVVADPPPDDPPPPAPGFPVERVLRDLG